MHKRKLCKNTQDKKARLETQICTVFQALIVSLFVLCLLQ